MSDSVSIFVVDDDFIIQKSVEQTLQDGGFTVISADSGQSAISKLNSGETNIRALVTDVNLGGDLTGWDVARHARQLNLTLPVVYMTGDSAHDWASHGVPDSVLISKPFAPAQIVSAVAELLNKQAS